MIVYVRIYVHELFRIVFPCRLKASYARGGTKKKNSIFPRRYYKFVTIPPLTTLLYTDLNYYVAYSPAGHSR